MGESWIFGMLLLYLTILSIYDCKMRKVPVLLLAAGVFIIVSAFLYGILTQGALIASCILGMIPGSLLILVAWITKKAGYADGIVMLILGGVTGYRGGVVILCMSLLILAVVSIVLLLFRKVKKNTRLPYLPFLTIAFLIQQLGWGGVV